MKTRREREREEDGKKNKGIKIESNHNEWLSELILYKHEIQIIYGDKTNIKVMVPNKVIHVYASMANEGLVSAEFLM